ncbi:ribonuclease J [Deltaproteobacteria bacterium]|nr:ribonuclease J [Deltaproteobacteria bacterium]
MTLPESATTDAFVTLTPLGGFGEIGLNCATLTTPQGMVMIDCGLMFPSDYHLGVDIVIPRFDSVLEKRGELKGIVITHGHEDHIGALPWLLAQIAVPVYASPFALALIAHKLKEHNLLDKTPLFPVSPETKLELAGCIFHFFPVSHSIIDGYGLGIETPVGNIVHTGDFKLDPTPLDGWGTDLEQFRQFSGPKGARLLLSDSTNVEREGHTLSEREVHASLRHFFAVSPGRIIVTLFSSHIQRIQEVFDCAKENNRSVVVNGRSLINNIEMACELGKLIPPPRLYFDSGAMPDLPDNEMTLLVTGSQGEPLSSLSRIARGDHKHLAIHAGDTVIMSSRLIPGNAVAVTKLINDLYRSGAEVYYESVHAIHTSGHAHKDELVAMLDAIRPEYFIPAHGEYRHLVKHRRLSIERGVSPQNALILEDGHPITLTRDAIRMEEPILAESILVDGKGVGDVGQILLKERHLLGDAGMVVAILVLDRASLDILHGPEVISKGFLFEQQYSGVLEEAKRIIGELRDETPPDEVDNLQDKIRSTLRRFFRKEMGRDPVVIPIVTVIDRSHEEQEDGDLV